MKEDRMRNTTDTSEQEDFFQEPEEEILNEEDLLKDDEEFPELDEETLEEMEKIEKESQNIIDLDDSVPDVIGLSDSVRMYLKEMGKYPLMTAEQEVECAKKLNRGMQRQRKSLPRQICVWWSVLQKNILGVVCLFWI